MISFLSRSSPKTSLLSRVMAMAVIGAALGVFGVFGASISSARAEGAFDGFEGSWSGGGTIQIADAGTERIRCRGTYSTSGGGSNLRQSLRCASDSYRFDLSTDIRSAGGNVSGYWSETSRGINGTVDGRVNSGNIAARVETNGYVATFNVATRGNKQTVAIASPGPIRAVNIALTRAN